MFFGGGGDFGFGFGDYGQGVVVGFFAFAGFVPHLVALVELLLSAVGVDFFGPKGVVGEDGDAVGENFNKTPVDVVDLFGRRVAAGAAVDAHVASTQFG